MNTQEYDQMMFYNPGIVKTQISSDLLNITKREIEDVVNSQPDKIMKNQYTLPINISLERFICNMANEYIAKYNFLVNYGTSGSNLELKVSKISKVNFQRKYEFSSSELDNQNSLNWILFASIPYEYQDELRFSKIAESGTSFTSKLEFIYNTLGSGISSHCINLDKTWEGTVLMFPSYLKHTMYPFYTSDDYRVFVSGKIWTVNRTDYRYVSGKQQDVW